MVYVVDVAFGFGCGVWFICYGGVDELLWGDGIGLLGVLVWLVCALGVIGSSWAFMLFSFSVVGGRRCGGGLF